MERAFAQRREQIVGDCLQLKTDVDVYNDMNRDKQPQIQLILNFTDDVEERQSLDELVARASNKTKSQIRRRGET
jgi:hypothetical protein